MKAINPEFTRLAQEPDSKFHNNETPSQKPAVKLTVPNSHEEEELPSAIVLEVMPANSFRSFGINE